MSNIKFQPFYLFYILSILLLIFGFTTNDSSIIIPGPMTIDQGCLTTTHIGYWSFVIPLMIFSLTTGLVYHFLYHLNKPMNTTTTIVHSVITILGCLLSFNTYISIILMLSIMPDTTAIGFDGLLTIIAGPVLLIVSLVIFFIGLVRVCYSLIIK